MNGREFTRLIVADSEGKAFDIKPDDFGQCPVFPARSATHSVAGGRAGGGSAALLKQFVSNELGQASDEQRAPKHIEYMRRHDLLDYCDASEKGHFKWYPKGLLIQNLLLDYAAELSREWGAFEMRNPMVLRGDQNVIGELMGEFHERDYKVDGGRGVCYLRYASDPLAFPFMQKVRFNRDQSPLKVYEEANCFRNEQQGEVSGLKRVRHFMMTDMHAACADVEQAKREFRHLCLEFAGLMDRLIARGRWVLGWEGTVAFYEENNGWLLGIGREISGHDIRSDVDDRDDAVGKKVRNAEKEWVPYTVVLGQKERESGRLSVRSRADGSQRELSALVKANCIVMKTHIITT